LFRKRKKLRQSVVLLPQRKSERDKRLKRNVSANNMKRRRRDTSQRRLMLGKRERERRKREMESERNRK
jgi:hypothetical protein